MSDSARIVPTTGDNYAMIVEQHQFVLLDFWAAWCSPCKQVGTLLDQLVPGYPNVTVAKIDADHQPGLAQQHQVTGLPTLILLDNGIPVAEARGAVTKQRLIGLLERTDG